MKKIKRMLRIGLRFVEQIYVIHKLEKIGIENNLTPGMLFYLIRKKESENNEKK